jgi:hypothetical protein
LLLGLFAVRISPAFCAESPDDDIILKALGDEMKRSMTLRLEGLDKPYFVQYAVDDSVMYRIEATYGALVSSDCDRSRTLHSQVRVGSYELDNSNFAGRGGFASRRGLSASAELPVDDDYPALRHAIWLTTDSQFTDAVEALTQKRAYMRDRTIEDRPRDFTQAQATTAIKERAALAFEPGKWEDYARRISARFGEFKHIQRADVNFTAGSETRYLVNSEGFRLRIGDTGALLRITAEAQADDGERLTDHLEYLALKPEQLPALADVLADVQKLADRLAATIKAPILEDYVGPVLLDGIAAPQFFRQLLARGLAGQPDPVGWQRRESQGTDNLESRVGKRILPVTFQIYDDPGQEKFQNTFLAGHYLFDDEGLPAQRVDLVVDGKLEEMVMSRAPTKLFGKSTGHGRRVGGDTPRASIGCLYVESTKGLTPEELKKELLDAADAEGLKFGLRIAAIQNRAGGGGSFGGRFGRGGGFARVLGDPIVIFRVFVADGREEPVRGCEFSSVDVRSLRRIIAAGNVQTVHNSVGGGSPASSVIAPAVLVEELELTRIKQEAEKKPILEAPHARR